MAASVRIEASAFADTRIELLGELAGYNRHEALGRLAQLWSVCTDRNSAVLDVTLVRSCLGPTGVQALIESGLGERTDDGIRVRGASPKRIGWLGKRRRASQMGGEGKRQASQSQAKQEPKPSQAEATEEPTGSPLTLTLSPSLTLSLKNPPKPPKGGDPPLRRKAGLAGASEAELATVAAVLAKLSERSGRSYGGDKGHRAKILGILREGYSENDLRLVVWDRANRWAGDPKMDEYLRPLTLFGPQKFPDYLAEAKAAWEESEREDDAKRHKGSNGLGEFLRGGAS